MDTIVLDTSAFLAEVNRENGAETVLSLLDQAIMSTVNVCEVATYLNSKLDFSLEACEHRITTSLKEVHDFNLEQSLIAASLHLKTKKFGLSLGDRACLALAISLDCNVYTADKIWKDLNNVLDLKIKIILIR